MMTEQMLEVYRLKLEEAQRRLNSRDTISLTMETLGGGTSVVPVSSFLLAKGMTIGGLHAELHAVPILPASGTKIPNTEIQTVCGRIPTEHSHQFALVEVRYPF